MSDHSHPAEPIGRMLSLKEVMAETSLSKATIYRLRQTGAFPQGKKLSPRRRAWSAADIERFKAMAED